MDLGHGDRWRLDACPACPAQTLPAGEFDVSERPAPASRYDPTAGYRIDTATGQPVCVHPSRIRLSADRAAGTDEPPPSEPELQPPGDVADLANWFGATLRAAAAESRATVLINAESAARQRFPASDVLAAIRLALSIELTHGILVRHGR